MEWWKRGFAAGAGILLLAFLESIRECRMFCMTHYKVDNFFKQPGEREYRIVFLSDLHCHVYGTENDILLECIRKETPDLILIGGDMLIGKCGRMPLPALDFIRQLPAIAPVYYALGNHEQRMQERPEKYKGVIYRYKQELCRAGICFLENDSAFLDLGSHKLRVTGLKLPMRSYVKFQRMNITAAEIRREIGVGDPDCYQILLAHNPAYVPAYKAWGADLILCGHLHGGIFRVPGWRGVVTPQAFLFPRYSGEMTSEDGSVVVVSKGLGTHTVNLRLFNRPEVVVLHF